MNIWKRKKGKIESRHLKLCYELRTFIKRIKAAFYRPDYQKFLIYPLIKRLDQAFATKYVAEPWKAQPSFWKIQPRVWKARSRVYVIVRPVMFQSATEINAIYRIIFLLLLCVTLGAELLTGRNLRGTHSRGITFSKFGRK